MTNLGHRRPLAAFMAALVGATLGGGVLAGATSAGADEVTTPGSGHDAYIEICKSYTPPTINEDATPSFQFVISGYHHYDGVADTPGVSYDGQRWIVTVQAGSGAFSCSKPIPVMPGTVTVSELPDSWYEVTSITEPPGDNYIVPGSVDVASGTVQVQVAADNSSTLQYTNAPVDGFVEVCKLATAGSPLAGSFTFNLVGEDGYTGTTTVPVGGCSQPAVEVPAGRLQVTEAGTNLYVTSIAASFDGAGGWSALMKPWPNLQTGTVTVMVRPATDPSEQTDVYYTNDVVQFKICKVWGGSGSPDETSPSPDLSPSGASGSISDFSTEPGGSSTLFPFALSSSGASGPTAVPASLSLLAGTWKSPVCSDPVQLRAGTAVTVTEGIVAASKVAAIVPDGALSLAPVTRNPDVVNRSVQVIVGEPVTGPPTDMVNEATVTFVDVAARPAPLKLCVAAGSPAPAGSSYNFTVSGDPGVTTTVALGSCAFVGGASSQFLFPFNSVQTITGVGVSPDQATAIGVQPTFVAGFWGGAVQASNEPVLAGPPSLAIPQVSVVIGEGGTGVTEVTFTIGGKTTTTTTTTTPTTTIPASSTNSSSQGPVVTSPATTTTTTAAANVARGDSAQVLVNPTAELLARDRASLAQVNKSIASVRRSLAKYQAALARATAAKLPVRVALAADVQRLQKKLSTLLTRQHQLQMLVKAFS